MAFTREQLAAYEKQPAKEISDKVNPFRGATPARQATAAEASAPTNRSGASQILDAAEAAPAAGATSDEPLVDEDGTLGDPTESGEGTSDEQPESSTGTVEHGDEAATDADLIGEEPTEEEPAKGSARERIVELNDKYEGAREFGKAMQDGWKGEREENARLRAQLAGGAPTTQPAAAAVVVNEDPGPMPDMSDEDVQFDNDKYRAKMAKWSKVNARAEARAIVQEMTGVSQAQALVAEVNSKVEAFKQEHPDFEEVVTNNQTLKANQLAPVAGLRVAKSPYTAEILMHFGNNPAYAIRVARMQPDEQLMEIGEIVAEIKRTKNAAKNGNANPAPKNGQKPQQTGAQPARKSQTNAPPPPTAVRGAGRPQGRDVLDPSMSMDEFVRQHREGNQAARAANRKARGLK